MPSFADQAASRRKFLQFLAGSPLLAAGGLEAFAGEGPTPGTKLPDPLMWAPMRTEDLIKSPKEAINVFDMEPVCRKNVPPAHFGYMASGIDDEVTLRANREGFLKFQLRPRRLVDVSKVDMCDRHSRREISEPDRARAGRRAALVPQRGRARQRARRQGRKPSADSLDRHQHRRRGRDRRARRADLVPALRHQQVGGGRALCQARGEGRLPRGRGHGRSLGGRNQETLFRLRPSDTRNCSECHDRSSLQSQPADQGDVSRRRPHRPDATPSRRP